MKLKTFSFAVLTLLLAAPLLAQDSEQISDFGGGADGFSTLQPEDQSPPLLTSADAIKTLIPERQPESPLDQNTDEEARLDTRPLDETVYVDPAATRKSIADRIAGVPGVDQSMDSIYQSIIDHFKQINCQKQPGSSKSAEAAFIKSLLEGASANSADAYSLCDEDIAPVVFTPLSDANTTRTSLFGHFRDNIYQPLGYEVPSNRFSYADTINDLINLDPDNSVIHKNMHGLNFGNFSGMVRQAFESVESAATDFDHNRGAISRQMVDILKSFHIFWNALRQKNRIGQTKTQTLAIIKQLMQQFRQTNSAMKATTLNILENIKEAYFRFMRAHKYQKLISRKPLETIAFQMLERYKANVIKIKDRAADSFSFVSEVAVFLDMLRAFHAVNRKNRLTPQESLQLFEQKVAQPMTTTYNVFQDVMVENGDRSFYKVREFTAVLLLKLKHRNHVMMRFYGWDDFFKAKGTADGRVFDNVVKFYEELVDGVMLVPTGCGELTDSALDQCFKDRLDAQLSDYSKKYMLQASIAGVSLYRYVQQAFESASADIVGAGASGNAQSFKEAFVDRVTKTFKQFRDDYRINDMSDVEELENNIGFQIEKIKSVNAMKPLSLALIDAFDKQLYAFFLDVKSAYNSYAPVTRDQRIMDSIVQKLATLVANFQADHGRQISDDTAKLMKVVVREGRLWAKRHSVQYVVNAHPVNLRIEPTGTVADAMLNRMNVNDIGLNVPLVGSMMMGPIGEQSADLSSEIGNQAMTDKFRSRRVV